MNNYYSKAIVALVVLLVITVILLPSSVSAQNEIQVTGDPVMAPPTGSVSGSPATQPTGSVTNSPATRVTGSVTNQPPTTVTGSSQGLGNTFYLQNPLNSRFNTVGGIVSGFLEIFTYLVIILAVLMLIWVGLKFILAQGNSEEIKKLKEWLLWIVVGVAIVIGARIIVRVVIDTLSASQVVNRGVIDSANNALRGN